MAGMMSLRCGGMYSRASARQAVARGFAGELGKESFDELKLWSTLAAASPTNTSIRPHTEPPSCVLLPLHGKSGSKPLENSPKPLCQRSKNRQPTTDNRQPRTENREPRTENREPRTATQKSEMLISQAFVPPAKYPVSAKRRTPKSMEENTHDEFRIK